MQAIQENVTGTEQQSDEVGDSFLINCVLIQRKDQKGVMFHQEASGKVYARLDGYAIIPVAQYEELMAAATKLLDLEKSEFPS